MSMSYNFGVWDLVRDGETSITQQLTDRIAGLIDNGELEPGDVIGELLRDRDLAAALQVQHAKVV